MTLIKICYREMIQMRMAMIWMGPHLQKDLRSTRSLATISETGTRMRMKMVLRYRMI